MRKQITFTIALFCTGSSSAQYKYPATKTVDAKDTYFGVTYTDSYRWLEDLKDPNAISWFKA